MLLLAKSAHTLAIDHQYGDGVATPLHCAPFDHRQFYTPTGRLFFVGQEKLSPPRNSRTVIHFGPPPLRQGFDLMLVTASAAHMLPYNAVSQYPLPLTGTEQRGDYTG
jgi:hypothetical protein